ncbi:MAG: tripartite tricarboxylate transporter permease [Acetobacteraceae bacterium]
MTPLVLHGLHEVFTLLNLGVITLGVIIGMVFGVIPGLSGATAMTMLLPLTFAFPADTGVLFLIAIWNAAVYSGSISAICLNIPGTAAAAACMVEGHALARRGLARRALRASIVGATIGGFAAALTLMLLAPPLGELALTFGPAEMFALSVFGMAAVVSLTSGSLVRGGISTLIGLLLAAVGTAPSGSTRFVFVPELVTGFPIVPTLIGLFTFPVLLEMILERRTRVAMNVGSLRAKDSFLLRLDDWRRHWFNIVRSAVIGVFLGVVPGHGPTIASFIAYSEARRAAREPNEFGHGDVDGVLAPETAANAAVFSSLVPALTLGIPGTADAVIVMAALTMHGMIPGPMLLARSGDILYTVFVGAFVANAMMLVVALLGARILASTTRAPLPIIAPIIVVFSLVGAYAVNQDVFDVFVALGVGLVGYGLRMVRIPLPPMVLGLILGAPIETYFLQARVLYDSVWDALTRPVCLVVLILTIAAVTFSLFKEFKTRRSPRRIA